jgi:RNA polymerase sigma factor (sigma-70 family)
VVPSSICASSNAATSRLARAPKTVGSPRSKDNDWLNEVLSQLTPAEREVLQFVADGDTYPEIASRTGLSAEAVRQRVTSARRRITKILTPAGSYRQPQAAQAPISREEAR